ncbi:LysR family transcriptional regulator [Acetobacter musti]|nr:LysR family transcriptional regulator [Acetobacter musti]
MRPRLHVHLTALRYFIETADAGSMRTAADRLSVSPSSVNRQILKLEDQLGCKLFDRINDGVALTAAGKVLLACVTRVEHDLETAATLIDDLRGLKQGHIHIACEDGIGRDFLPGTLAAFQAEFPKVTYTITVRPSVGIFSMITDGTADIGLAMEPPAPADIKAEAAEIMPAGIITAPGHALAHHRTVTLQDLAPHRLIHSRIGLGGVALLPAGTDQEPPFVNTNSPDMTTSLVQAGLGISIRTPVGIISDIETGRIVFIPIAEHQASPPKLCLYSRRHRGLSIAAEKLAQRLSADLPSFRNRVRALVTS